MAATIDIFHVDIANIPSKFQEALKFAVSRCGHYSHARALPDAEIGGGKEDTVDINYPLHPFW
ncbi:hypothetical protein ACLOJK_041646 [Asimina triloba]